MRRATHGSALLMVLIVMALLVSVVGLATKTTFFMQSLSYDFHKTQNTTNITQGMLAYAVALAHENYDECIKYSEPIHCTLDLGQHQGVITISQADGNLKIEALLYEGAVQTCSMNCALAKDTENKIQVQCFQR